MYGSVERKVPPTGDAAKLMAGMNFPPTRYSAVRGASSADASERSVAWDRLAETYRKPVAKYIMMKWRIDESEADDLTQGFFYRTNATGTANIWNMELILVNFMIKHTQSFRMISCD